jgi:hypothetical protein
MVVLSFLLDGPSTQYRGSLILLAISSVSAPRRRRLTAAAEQHSITLLVVMLLLSGALAAFRSKTPYL